MLTEIQVNNFFLEVLEFPNWKEMKETNQVEFLKQLVQKYQYHCYFHNTEMASTPPEQRRAPVKADTVRIGVEGTGGVCIHQNAFMTLILQSLDFNAYISAGNCLASESEGEGNHCMCILKVSEKEIYAIDVGCAQPVDEAIPLHKLPYHGIAAGFRYEYRYNEALDLYERWQFDGTFFRGKFVEDEATKAQLRYYFSIVPKDFDYFNKTLLDIFTNPETSIFLKSPFLFRCLDLDAEAGKNGRRFIVIFGASVVIYDNVNREATGFTSYKEMQPLILKHFPKIAPAKVEKALDYFCSISAKGELQHRA